MNLVQIHAAWSHSLLFNTFFLMCIVWQLPVGWGGCWGFFWGWEKEELGTAQSCKDSSIWRYACSFTSASLQQELGVGMDEMSSCQPHCWEPENTIFWLRSSVSCVIPDVSSTELCLLWGLLRAPKGMDAKFFCSLSVTVLCCQLMTELRLCHLLEGQKSLLTSFLASWFVRCVWKPFAAALSVTDVIVIS